jgi:hypothetical protein
MQRIQLHTLHCAAVLCDDPTVMPAVYAGVLHWLQKEQAEHLLMTA